MSARRFRGIAGSLAAALWVAGCAVGPDFKPPAPPDVSRYTKEPLARSTSASDAPGGAAQHFVQGRDIAAEWWRMFRSPALNRLVNQSIEANPTLQAAMAALRVANENKFAQEGKFFPFVQANFNPQRQQTSQAIAPIPNSGANVFNLYTAQVMVSYTIDIWGQNRRAVESLQAQADVQRFQVEAAYLTLTSNVVVAAIQEASLRGQIAATNRLIVINSKMLTTIREQFDRGLINRSDVAAQEASLAQIQATLPPLRKALAQTRDLLAALLGRYPSEQPREQFTLDGLRLPRDLPLSLPAQLVEQRPDVRAAEEQLHSAGALVGVAIAAMLPNVTLNGNAGYQATQMAELINPSNFFFTIAGNATQTVFDGFTLVHQLRAADANFDQAAWVYRGTVITALQNVADTLRALQNDADALKAARDFERAAKISLDLAQQQMTSGNANVLLLLNAQITYQQAVLQVVQAEANRFADTAALFQALGGGWWNRPEKPPEKVLDVATGEAKPLEEKQHKWWWFH
jgi:NodT family efflux transporter outer membrane factor (OMF) lipoprotein